MEKCVFDLAGLLAISRDERPTNDCPNDEEVFWQVLDGIDTVDARVLSHVSRCPFCLSQIKEILHVRLAAGAPDPELVAFARNLVDKKHRITESGVPTISLRRVDGAIVRQSRAEHRAGTFGVAPGVCDIFGFIGKYSDALPAPQYLDDRSGIVQIDQEQDGTAISVEISASETVGQFLVKILLRAAPDNDSCVAELLLDKAIVRSVPLEKGRKILLGSIESAQYRISVKVIARETLALNLDLQ